MTEKRGKYKTKQREIVASYLANNKDRYLSIDEIWSGVSTGEARIGRSTVYRCLNIMTQEGTALKATAPGGEARYRAADNTQSGQLICLGCGQAFSLECHMVSEFSDHVLKKHDFEIDASRTVLYGKCSACRGAE